MTLRYISSFEIRHGNGQMTLCGMEAPICTPCRAGGFVFARTRGSAFAASVDAGDPEAVPDVGRGQIRHLPGRAAALHRPWIFQKRASASSDHRGRCLVPGAWCLARHPDAADELRSERSSAAYAYVSECGDKKGSLPMLDENIARHCAVLTPRRCAEALLTWAAAQDGIRWHAPRMARAIRGRQPGVVAGGPSGRIAIAAAEPAAAATLAGKKRSRHRARSTRRRRQERGGMEPSHERRSPRTVERYGCRDRRSRHSIGRR